MFFVDFFERRRIRRMLADTMRHHSTLAGLCGRVKNRPAHHAPQSAPVGELFKGSDCRRLAPAHARRQQETETKPNPCLAIHLITPMPPPLSMLIPLNLRPARSMAPTGSSEYHNERSG